MDIVSWDNYPAYDTPWSMIAMKHDLMRGLKNEPFMLMEQTPSQQNWQKYNSLNVRDRCVRRAIRRWLMVQIRFSSSS